MGNRLTKTEGGVTTTYAYDLCNKLLSESADGIETTYAYDAIGNLVEKTDSTGTTTYTYDALNQLKEVVNPDGTWQSNTYDASGIRSMIAEYGITTEFMTFNGLVLSGYNKDREQTEHYYYGNSLLAMEQSNNSTETSLYYYLKNSHGDVIGLSDNKGTLTETYCYDAFGTLTSIQSLNENGVLEETETAVSRFLYASEQLDNTTGLYYLRARQYNTVIGRFTQEDTYLGDGRNLYVYVSNNPLKYVDPSGHDGAKNLRDKINAPLIGMSSAAEELYDPVIEQQKKDNWERFVNGTNNVAKGFIITASGVIVIYFMPAAIPEWLKIAGGTLGMTSIGMGLSDATEGVQEYYYSATDNAESESINPVEEIFFDGNDVAYDVAEMAVVSGAFASGLAGVAFAEVTAVNYGNVANYANLVSQGKDFLETVDIVAEGNSNANNARLALGLSDYLDEFASSMNAHTWKDFADVTNWQQGVLNELRDPNVEIVFNLDGIDSVWKAITRASSGRGGATDWELFQIYNNPEFWNKITWYQNGIMVPNPFE